MIPKYPHIKLVLIFAVPFLTTIADAGVIDARLICKAFAVSASALLAYLMVPPDSLKFRRRQKTEDV